MKLRDKKRVKYQIRNLCKKHGYKADISAVSQSIIQSLKPSLFYPCELLVKCPTLSLEHWLYGRISLAILAQSPTEVVVQDIILANSNGTVIATHRMEYK